MTKKVNTVTCKFCGNEIPAGSLYCMFCGNQLVKKIEPKEKKEVKVPEPKQLPSGNWYVRVKVNNHEYYITKDSYAECKAEAIAIKTGLKKPEKNFKKTLLKTIVQKFINDNTAVLSPSTIRGYSSLMDNHFQSIMDRDVNTIKWQAAVNEEAAKSKPKTVINAWRVITGALRAYDYPVPEVNLPKNRSNSSQFLDYSQLQIFLKAIEGKSCEKACLLALHSLRISEILALKPESISNGTIKVKGAVVPNQDNKFVYKDTNKNATSTREIPIMIPRLLEIWPKAGEPLTFQSQTTLREQIERVCKANNLPIITIHCLRHSFASLAYHLGWNMMTTCLIGGWNTPFCVQRIYTHLSTLDKNEDIEKMKSFYNKGINSDTKKSVTKSVMKSVIANDS